MPSGSPPASPPETVTARPPVDLPDLFLDRSLGRVHVPATLRAAGVRLQTLADVYGSPADEAVADVDWLELAGRHEWPVLMKDARIRYRAVERRALLTHGVRAFCLTNGNLRAAEMAQQFLDALPAIQQACQVAGPFLFAVSRAGLRRIDMSTSDDLS